MWSSAPTPKQKPKAAPTVIIPRPGVVPISDAANTASSVAMTMTPATSATKAIGLLMWALPTATVAIAPSSDASATQK